MTRILAISDEVEQALYGETLGRLRPDVVVSCGDLPFDYLEYIVTVLSVPVLYVPGNHDPELSRPDPGPLFGAGVWPGTRIGHAFEPPPGPQGCINVDGRIEEAGGLAFAGLGGSIRYADGPNRYTQAAMRRRAARLKLRAGLRRIRGMPSVDVVLAHSPPLGLGDVPDDPAHAGFAAFHSLIRRLRPSLFLHGHVHPHGEVRPDRRMGHTLVVNVIPYRVLEVSGEGARALDPGEVAERDRDRPEGHE